MNWNQTAYNLSGGILHIPSDLIKSDENIARDKYPDVPLTIAMSLLQQDRDSENNTYLEALLRVMMNRID